MKKTGNGFSSLLVLGIAAVIIILGGLFVYTKTGSKTGAMTSGTTRTNEQTPTADTTPTPVVAKGSDNSNSLTNGTSNADLDKDLQTIGAKMNTVNNASAAVDSSINNQSSDSVTNLQ